MAEAGQLRREGTEAAAGEGLWEGPSFNYPFTQDDFARIRALIYRTAGIALAPGKMDMVYSRLARRLRARELESFAEYLALLEQGEQSELEAFINALTTNMTSFFREPHHFRTLAERLSNWPRGRRLAIWCCASSTGEEPFSIAMTALDALGAGHPPPRVLATDIDTNVLATARQGIYPANQAQRIPTEYLKRFFLKGEGKNAGFMRARDELMRTVTFRRLNLLEKNWPMTGRFDFIFCRNVMIYFDRETQHAILDRISHYLEPDGLLFVGHSESFHSAGNPFKVCGRTAYRLK